MKRKILSLAKDSAVYGLGDVLGKSILFLLIPVFTRIFSPQQYGEIETLVMLNNFLGIFLMMGLDAAQSFYFFERDKSDPVNRKKLISAVIQWRLLWGVVIITVASMASPILNQFFFNARLNFSYFAVAFIGTLFFQITGQVTEVFRLLYQPVKYVIVSLIFVLLSSAISLFLVVLLKWGILGYFIGYSLGAVISALLGCYLIREYLDFSLAFNPLWPRLLSFGAPFVLNGFAMYALLNTDRWFLMSYQGQASLGIYAVGAKFVIFILVAVNAFRAAWWPMAMEALHSDGGAVLFRTVSRLYLGVSIIGVILLTYFSRLLMRLFSAPDYFSAYPVIGILSWHGVFYGFYLLVCSGIWKNEKTLLSGVAIVIAVIVNVLLNGFLVPRYGLAGAALATSISFFIWTAITMFISERIEPIKFPLGIFLLQICVGVAACYTLLFIYRKGFSNFLASGIVIASILSIFLTLRWDFSVKTK